MLAFTGDPHLSDVLKVSRRTDNYMETGLKKFEYICRLCVKRNISKLILPGDIFDKPSVMLELLSRLIDIIQKYKIDLYVIAGQHDLTFRYLSPKRSPLLFFERLGLLTILTDTPVEVEKSVGLYGLSYGETENKVKIDPQFDKNILVIHRQVAPKAIGPGHEFLTIKQVAKKYRGFDLIICGDYHYNYVGKVDDILIVNAGAMIRKSLTDLKHNHKPCFYLYNSLQHRVIKKEIPHEPSEVSFDLSGKIMQDEAVDIKDKVAEELITSIQEVPDIRTIPFRDRLVKRCRDLKAGDEILKIFDNLYAEFGGDND